MILNKDKSNTVISYINRCWSKILPELENVLKLGLIKVFVRRANIRFAPTLVSDIGWISITTIYPKTYDRLLILDFSLKGCYICKQLKKKCNALSGLHRWLIFTWAGMLPPFQLRKHNRLFWECALI